MSVARTNPGGAKDEPREERRHFEIVKGGIAFLAVLLLLLFGFQGRQHATLQAKLGAVTVIRDQLQQRLEEEHRSIQQVFEGVRGTNANAGGAPSPSAEVQPFISALRQRLDQFESEYDSGNLPPAENLELRMNQATLANAEQRFADALATLAGGDGKAKAALAAGRRHRWADWLEVRGDAFYGLHQWRDALADYKQLLIVQPTRLAALERVAECQNALGSRDEALAACSGLARMLKARAEARLAQGKPAAAIGEFKQALDIYSRLVEQEGRKDLIPEFTDTLRLYKSAGPYRVPPPNSD